MVTLPMFSVTVPMGTQDPTANTEVAKHTTRNCIHGSSWSIKHTVHVVVSYLQTVSLPVRTEEHVDVLTTPLAVTAPLGTQDLTAKTEVRIH